jgi:hypothetical protein
LHNLYNAIKNEITGYNVKDKGDLADPKGLTSVQLDGTTDGDGYFHYLGMNTPTMLGQCADLCENNVTLPRRRYVTALLSLNFGMKQYPGDEKATTMVNVYVINVDIVPTYCTSEY